MRKFKRFMILTLVGCLSLNLVACESTPSAESDSAEITGITANTDGTTTYETTARGYGGDVVAQVTLDADGKVIGLEVTADGETPTIGLPAVEPMIKAILDAGNPDVDAVSGATITSVAIKNAVYAALTDGGFSEATIGEIHYTPGTYTGTGTGHGGEIVATVTVSENAIESIVVTGERETPGVSTMPFEQLPKDIINFQSLGVDAISSATLTSHGVINAVADALTEAGADVDALRRVPVQKDTTAIGDQKTQVVVAGGGMAGMMAALTAAHEGAEVILVEKEPFLGGSLMLAAGGMAFAESETVNPSMDDSVEPMIDNVRRRYESSVRQPNYEFLQYTLVEAGKTVDYLYNEFDLAPESNRGGYGRYGGGEMGAGFVADLERLMNEAGVKVITNAAADEILMEDGKAIGLRVTHVNGDFAVMADKVIMATGGAAGNKDMLLEATPQLANMQYDVQASVGNTGDGYRMLEEIGARMGAGPYLKGAFPNFWLGFRFTWMSTPPIATNLVVDADGERIATGDSVSPYDTLIANENLIRRGSPANWTIYSAENIDANLKALFDEHTAEENPDIVLYADTIKELAEKTGMKQDTLEASIARYRTACESGVDEEFDKDATRLSPLPESGGYYAARVMPSTWGTYGGAITDRSFRVLDTNGAVIPNLFGAGEVAGSEFFGDYYVGAFSLGLYSAAGRVAAQTAVQEINAAN